MHFQTNELQQGFPIPIPQPPTEPQCGRGADAADALRREFGSTDAAIKLTQAHERAVKNWLLAKNGSDGAHIIMLMSHSHEVLEAILQPNVR